MAKLARARCVAFEGVAARLVTVEANISPGLPGIYMVGMGDTAIRESKDRIRTAAANTALEWPKTKIIVSLSPASLPKYGSHFDLAIILAILSAAQPDPEPQERLARTLLLGEVGLSGQLRPVDGVVPALLAAEKQAEFIDAIIIPPGNAAEAAAFGSSRVLVARNIQEAEAYLRGATLPSASQLAARHLAPEPSPPDFADIAGLAEAKRAAEIAAAGGHHLFLIGSPGSGKSMLAARLPGILPQLTRREMLESTAVRSIAGLGGSPQCHAPVVAPHHSITRAGLLGGGSGHAAPGAVSLAHHGVLFLDEVADIPAQVLDSLRLPLETGEVRLVRNTREIIFPAEFQLVMAANPCRCAAEEPTACRCSAHQRARYLNNVSGPLRDRLDIICQVSSTQASLRPDTESSAVIAERVAAARERAASRWRQAGWSCSLNGRVEGPRLRRNYPAEETAMALLEAYLSRGEITQRGVDRALRVAWTLADLAAFPRPRIDHVAEALGLRTMVDHSTAVVA